MRNPQQPRTVFDPGELQALSDSLQTDGLINPIAVEGPDQGGNYTLVDGERRWRAARLAGWSEIEASVRAPLNGTGDRDRLFLAMAANLQRSDMGPVDEARAYRELVELGYTQSEIARRVGRSPSAISSKLRLLDFAPALQAAINGKSIPLDERVNASLRKLSPAQQETLGMLAERKKMSSMQVVGICTRSHKQQPVKAIKPKVEPSECPPLSQYKPLAKYGDIDHLVRRACKNCGLYDESGQATICPSCPLMYFVMLAGVAYGRRKTTEGGSND